MKSKTNHHILDTTIDQYGDCVNALIKTAKSPAAFTEFLTDVAESSHSLYSSDKRPEGKDPHYLLLCLIREVAGPWHLEGDYKRTAMADGLMNLYKIFGNDGSQEAIG